MRSQYNGWTHETLFSALWQRNRGQTQKAGRYAYLYPQKLGEHSAVLYEATSSVKRRPLFLRADGASARLSLFAALEPFIELKYTERKPSGFARYAVCDWNGVARALKLPPSPHERQGP